MAYDTHPKAGSINTCRPKTAQASTKVIQSNGRVWIDPTGVGWVDLNKYSGTRISSQDRAKNAAAAIWSSTGVLSGRASGMAVTTRKKGDHAIGSSNLGATGLSIWRSQPFAELLDGVGQGSGRSELPSSEIDFFLGPLQSGFPDSQRWSWPASMDCGWACWSCFFATLSQDVVG